MSHLGSLASWLTRAGAIAMPQGNTAGRLHVDRMVSLAPFVERRGPARLRATPLRRRNHLPWLPQTERRRCYPVLAHDIAGILERQLDRHPTKAEMLAFVGNLSGESNLWARSYLEALRRAESVLREAEQPHEAIATLHGYQTFMASMDQLKPRDN